MDNTLTIISESFRFGKLLNVNCRCKMMGKAQSGFARSGVDVTASRDLYGEAAKRFNAP